MEGYPDIPQVLKYLNNQNQIATKHQKNAVAKQNSNTHNQICSKITAKEKHGKLLGSNQLSV